MARLGFFLAIVLFLLAAKTSEAKHYIYLPSVPNTPLMQQVIKNQTYTWCVDSRAANYPNFVTQLKDVNDQYTKTVGINWQQVPFPASSSDTSCQVRHVMPDGLSCTGWAAQVFYASWPVTVQYCWTLGYTDWRSAQGHELGHALLGLHEQYDDVTGLVCTKRTDTVMDCGSGVRYPTALDINRGCAIILKTWCGKDPADRYYFADGWSYQPSTGWWWNPDNQPEWTACNADGLRWSLYLDTKFDGVLNGVGGLWYPPGSGFFDPVRGYWAFAGAC